MRSRKHYPSGNASYSDGSTIDNANFVYAEVSIAVNLVTVNLESLFVGQTCDANAVAKQALYIPSV